MQTFINYLQGTAILSMFVFVIWLEGYQAPPEPPSTQEQIEAQELLNRASRLLLETTSGRFNSSNVRGMGIWRQGDGLIYNTTDKRFLSTESGIEEVEGVQGRIIFGTEPPKTMEASPAPAVSPLSDEDAIQMIQLFNARTWEAEYSGELLCGWMVISLLSGVVPFRPHVWVNAPSSTGKSFLHKDVLDAIGGLSMHLDGAESSEAGLRGALAGAAIPIVRDELERDVSNKEKDESIKKVIAFVRNATKGGRIFKGVQGGAVLTYKRLKPRSCSSQLTTL